jgi:hypothetical protein
MGLHAKYSLFYFQVVMKFELSQNISKNTQISNFINIRPLKAELFHVQVRTDIHDEANNRFSKFSKAPKNEKKINKSADTINNTRDLTNLTRLK